MDGSLRVKETLRMARGEVARIRPAPGTAIRVRRGRVWLTEFGGGRDWSLGCGATHAIAGRGIALIESISPAVVDVVAPAGWPTLAREAAGRWLSRLAVLARTDNPA